MKAAIEPARAESEDPGRLLTIRQACDMLNCSQAKLYRLFTLGLLKKIKFVGSTRVSERSVRQLMRDFVDGKIEDVP